MLRRIFPAMLVLALAAACGGADVSPSQPSSGAPPAPRTTFPDLSTIPGFIGTYTLTFTAGSGCSLPPEAMKLTFARAYVYEQPPGSVGVDLYTNFPCWGCTPGFKGARQGDSVSFILVGGDPGDDTVVEVLGNEEIRYDGTATATFGSGTITGTFSGRISVMESSTRTTLAACTAADHKMDFVVVPS